MAKSDKEVTAPGTMFLQVSYPGLLCRHCYCLIYTTQNVRGPNHIHNDTLQALSSASHMQVVAAPTIPSRKLPAHEVAELDF